jgi:hypothetical protein
VLSDDIHRLRDTGEIADRVDADHVARCVLAAWEGLQLAWLWSPEFDIGEELNRLIAALVGTDSVIETPRRTDLKSSIASQRHWRSAAQRSRDPRGPVVERP